MNHEITNQPISFFDSAARRTVRARSWLWRKLRPFIVCTRKKPDGSEKMDGPEYLHRAMIGAVVLMVATICPWTRPLFGLPPAEKDSQVLAEIKQDVSSLKTDVRSLTVRVDNIERQVVTGMIEGMRRGAR